ncbi:hypothetical protein QTO34_012529 [Cnephaeus nilssonii]|uniref:Atg6 BARA domain-containing protein n=1 Tax=Cnephaeus nilssonii TaxID=3371016 RepID=A0AA40HBF7_CNENI|nr:hypothetical protein QTO34_012529 [Eptesicus nilssonii]
MYSMISTSSGSLTCQFCHRFLPSIDLSPEPAALNLPSAQGGPGATPEEGSASRMETDELWSVEDRLRHAQTQLAWLKRTNAFKAAFEIGCDGPIAIINSFRLGCTPTVPVSWGEINSAWGQAALLLVGLAHTVGLQFQRYQLIPRGDHSYLQSLTEDPVDLPLFCTGGKSSLVDSKFDQAMAAFLDCMQQFNEEAEPALCMPYSRGLQTF